MNDGEMKELSRIQVKQALAVVQAHCPPLPTGPPDLKQRVNTALALPGPGSSMITSSALPVALGCLALAGSVGVVYWSMRKVKRNRWRRRGRCKFKVPSNRISF